MQLIQRPHNPGFGPQRAVNLVVMVQFCQLGTWVVEAATVEVKGHFSHFCF